MVMSVVGIPVGSTRASQRRKLERVLGAGPWCWPEDAEARAWLAALGLVCPPAVVVGQVPLVAVGPAGGSLWSLGGAGEGCVTVGFGPEAERAWARAGRALARALPVAWRSLRDAVQAMPRATYLGQSVAPHQAERPEPLLDGASFGLAFAMALTSRVTGRALAGDWAASACVDEEGCLGPVDGLEQKLQVVTTQAPQVARFLVAESQRDEAEALSEGRGLQVVGVATLAQALVELAPDLEQWMVDVARPESRRERVEAIHRLALGGRAALVEWAPVGRAAARMLAAWSDLTPELAAMLRFAESVAARHQGLRRPQPLPTQAVLATLPQPHRTRTVAHAVQNAADAGCDDLDALEALARAYAPEALADCFPAQLELRGALARLWAVTGRPREAALAQLALAAAWTDRGDSAEGTYNLSELFRLAGALRDEFLFASAEAARDRAATLGELNRLGGDPYVHVARGRALTLLGRHAEAAAVLEPWGTRADLPDHLRLMALRWRVRSGRWLARDAGQPIHEEALAAGSPRGSHLTRRVRALVELDAALFAGDTDGATQAVDALAVIEPQPLSQLRRAWRPELCSDPLDYVARFYPY